jgi:hypothetical protein
MEYVTAYHIADMNVEFVKVDSEKNIILQVDNGQTLNGR